jgi:hypothetical protein
MVIMILHHRRLAHENSKFDWDFFWSLQRHKPYHWHTLAFTLLTAAATWTGTYKFIARLVYACGPDSFPSHDRAIQVPDRFLPSTFSALMNERHYLRCSKMQQPCLDPMHMVPPARCQALPFSTPETWAESESCSQSISAIPNKHDKALVWSGGSCFAANVTISMKQSSRYHQKLVL